MRSIPAQQVIVPFLQQLVKESRNTELKLINFSSDEPCRKVFKQLTSVRGIFFIKRDLLPGWKLEMGHFKMGVIARCFVFFVTPLSKVSILVCAALSFSSTEETMSRYKIISTVFYFTGSNKKRASELLTCLIQTLLTRT